MPDFKEILDKLKKAFEKLDTTKKIILGSILGVVVIALILIANVSSEQSKVVLYKGLTPTEFAQYTKKIEDMGESYSTSGTDTIFVRPEKREKIIIALAQENMIPKGKPGWEIFDQDKWTQTQFEKNINKQRALMGALEHTIETLSSIEDATVNIAFPEAELFQEKVLPVTAAILVKYAPGVESLKRKEIEGIVTLTSRAVPGLKKENVSVAGPDGEILNDFDNAIDKEKWELKSVEYKLRIQEKERIKLLSDIKKSLSYSFGSGIYGSRYDVVRLDLKMRWDKEEVEKQEVSPVVMKPDDPNTPYSELEVKDSLEVSSKKTTEEFEGNGFTPEGPAGTEPNIPPGYKDKDYQKAKYKKTENIKNNEFNKAHRSIKKQPWEYDRVALAVILDGHWKRLGEKEDGSGYKRKYEPLSDDELRTIQDVLKKAIGYDQARGDMISVKNIQKDRSKQFEMEDAELRAKKARQKLLMGTLIGLLAIVIMVVAYQAIKKEMERRRRIREEELALQQQMMREAALRAIEEEGVDVEMSLEEKARKEMLENAIALAKEKPEDVAQLIRTWLAED